MFPSASETQGLVLVEALAAGLPVVAVDTPETRDVLGGAGSLVPADPRAMALALAGALAGGDRRGARVAAERYDQDRIVDRVLGIYRSLQGPASKAG